MLLMELETTKKKNSLGKKERKKKLCLSRENGGIRFMMIHEFNLALLAKKLWRLVQFHNSFMARVKLFCPRSTQTLLQNGLIEVVFDFVIVGFGIVYMVHRLY